MTQSGKLMPNLDQKGTKTLNLTVLQRIDPCVEEILMTAAHVTFYEFNIDVNQWSRKDVEGSLFVVKRNAQPRFQFIVMNRRSTDNLVEDLLDDFEYEVQAPYLLYRNGTQEVNGIWFYNSQDCEAVASLFSRILNAFSKVPPKPKLSTTKSSEYEELEAVPTLDVIEGPLEPPRSSVISVSDVPDSTFLNFFSAAMNIGNASNVAITGQPHPLSAAIPSVSHTPNAVPSTVPFLPSAPSMPTSSTSVMPLIDAHESSSNNYHSSSLVKPSFFSAPSSSLMMPPIPSSMPTAPPPPLLPPVAMQRPYGTPLLQPFPPPTPPPSLTPAQNVPIITRDKVRDALLRLVQESMPLFLSPSNCSLRAKILRMIL